ncbi:MAG TPA: LLM class flavin-dependent oxidoreductase [Chloroflexia bacterium]|nr:LLM class flavin-dependent oxidoreductase [Chloroflexia bacterium]
MSKIDFGWFVPPLGIAESGFVPLAIYQQERILPAVVAHFDSLWVPDHLYAFDNPAEPFLECWTTITWLAARFPGVRLGPIVLAVGFRNPALLAKMAATLQALSGGRFIMGIGAGWREVEYGTYGYDFPRTAIRIKQLADGLEIMCRMWTEDGPSFEGEYYRIAGAYCAPRPDPAPPLMIGGSGEQLMLPLIARYADIWDRFHGGNYDTVDMAAYTRKRDLLHGHAAARGRDPASIRQSLTLGGARLPDSTGDSARWVDHLQPLIDAGVRQFILDCGHVASTDPVLRFAEEVIYPLNSGG